MTSLGPGSGFRLHSLSAQRDWLQVAAAAGHGLLSPAVEGGDLDSPEIICFCAEGDQRVWFALQ